MTFVRPSTVPVLLPYKPHGSDELFYMPKTEADVSSTNQSDTTMESSHTGKFVSNIHTPRISPISLSDQPKAVHTSEEEGKRHSVEQNSV